MSTIQQDVLLWVQKNREDVSFWGVFLTLSAILMYLFSDWDFSVLLTLSSILSFFAFLTVAVKIEVSHSIKGVSLKMFEAYLVVYLFRLFAILPYDGYLPYDRSGDWLYQSIELMSFIMICLIVALSKTRYARTYEQSNDTFAHHYLILAAFILSLLFHPSLNSFLPVDISWTFALYLESLTVLPQLFMFQRAKQAEPVLTHFLAAQALSRVLSFVFWANSHAELNDRNHDNHVGASIGLGPLKGYVGHWVVVMQLVQIVLMADFLWLYVKCLRRGISVENILTVSDFAV
jgi:hypothetical protein